MDIVEILSTGVSGFSFLMLMVGYNLTSTIQKRILDINLQDIAPKKLEVWMQIAERQLSNTRYFMMFATVFLVCGLFVLVYRPEANVILSISPVDQEFPPLVYVQNAPVALDENGHGAANVRSEHGLSIDQTQFYTQFNQLKRDLAAAEAAEKSLAIRLSSAADDSGYAGFLTGE